MALICFKIILMVTFWSATAEIRASTKDNGEEILQRVRRQGKSMFLSVDVLSVDVLSVDVLSVDVLMC